MKKSNKNIQDVFDLLPATAKTVAKTLNVSRTTASIRLKILITKGLAVQGEKIVIPHGFEYIYYKATPDAKPEINAPKCIMPITTLTNWVGGNPYLKDMT
jgi:predicted transcriptional regulator